MYALYAVWAFAAYSFASLFSYAFFGFALPLFAGLEGDRAHIAQFIAAASWVVSIVSMAICIAVSEDSEETK